MPEATPVSKWGKQHWSLLAYIEERCVNRAHIINKRILDLEQHEIEKRDGSVIQGTDEDVLEDLIAAGMVVRSNTPTVEGVEEKEDNRLRCALTELGWDVSAALRKHLGKGGRSRAFTWG